MSFESDSNNKVYSIMPDNEIKARLFFWEGSVLFFGPLSDTTTHSHHAAQITIGLDGPFHLKMSGVLHETRIITIPPNQRHQLDGGQGKLAIALIDGTLDLGRAIAAGGVIPVCDRLNEIPATIDEAKNYLKHLTKHTAQQTTSQIDKRIARVLAVLEKPDDTPTNAATLAKLANLSQSRFLHLFKETTGLPLRRYILWRRIINSIEAAGQGADLTSAAHMGGFADSSHFSRTFRETFGLSPSKLLKNSQNIQVITR